VKKKPMSSDKPARLSPAQSTRSPISEVSADAVYEHGKKEKKKKKKRKKKEISKFSNC
jgi:hypothetical protein